MTAPDASTTITSMAGSPSDFLDLLRCPATQAELLAGDGSLTTRTATPDPTAYQVTPSGIPCFADAICSGDGRLQSEHYDRVAAEYLTNLGYPHTQEYMAYLDRVLLADVGAGSLGTTAELCCGRGESFVLLKGRMDRGIGIDVSRNMLEAARREHPEPHLLFVQGDATQLPLASSAFDHVFMLGGIHHVPDRQRLFAEVHRILKPGGRFIFREPVSDFLPWRMIRAIVYRASSSLDHRTERPLLWQETVPVLTHAKLHLSCWQTYGFLGFCFFMNSDILVFNRLFRFIPGIRAITRLAAGMDHLTTCLPGLKRAGLQVVGVAVKPEQGS